MPEILDDAGDLIEAWRPRSRYIDETPPGDEGLGVRPDRGWSDCSITVFLEARVGNPAYSATIWLRGARQSGW